MSISKEVMISVVLVYCTVMISSSSGSAIPMWEYLSRGEKMSHLYSMFAKQVNSHCKTITLDHAMKPQCKRDLLMYGLGKLQQMSESHLDSMDPYQRAATDIIWDSMMDGHPTVGKKDSTTAEPIREHTGQYSRNPIFDDDKSQPQSHKPSTHEDYAMGMDMDTMYGQYQLPRDDENLYPEPQNHLHQESPTNVNEQYLHPSGLDKGYLSGPMMVMVRPDGTPVEQYLPKDDDKEAMTIGKQGLPTVEQIVEHFGTTKNKLEENQELRSTTLYPSYRGVNTNQQYRQQQQQQREFMYHNNNFRTFAQRFNSNHH